jgi:hypothetical protein
MLKLFLLTCFILALLFSRPAIAVDQNIILNATVAKYCTIAGSASPGNDTVTIPTTNGVVTTTPITRSYAVVCNSAANVTLTSLNGALTTATAGGAGFDNFINYAAATSGIAVLSGATTNSGGSQLLDSKNTAGPVNSNLNVTITPASANPLAGGDYTDTLKVSITPIM